METPEVEETKGFWKTNKELLLSTLVSTAEAFCNLQKTAAFVRGHGFYVPPILPAF